MNFKIYFLFIIFIPILLGARRIPIEMECTVTDIIKEENLKGHKSAFSQPVIVCIHPDSTANFLLHFPYYDYADYRNNYPEALKTIKTGMLINVKGRVSTEHDKGTYVVFVKDAWVPGEVIVKTMKEKEVIPTKDEDVLDKHYKIVPWKEGWK